MRVLVVDDDSDFTNNLSALKPADMILDVANGTEEAFDLLHNRQPDAIVLDLHMLPVLASDASNEGLAVLGAVMGGYMGKIPVVIATDLGNPEVKSWCQRLGAADVLDKADGLTRVFAAVERAVRSKCGERDISGDGSPRTAGRSGGSVSGERS